MKRMLMMSEPEATDAHRPQKVVRGCAAPSTTLWDSMESELRLHFQAEFAYSESEYPGRPSA